MPLYSIYELLKPCESCFLDAVRSHPGHARLCQPNGKGAAVTPSTDSKLADRGAAVSPKSSSRTVDRGAAPGLGFGRSREVIGGWVQLQGKGDQIQVTTEVIKFNKVRKYNRQCCGNEGPEPPLLAEVYICMFLQSTARHFEKCKFFNKWP